MAKPLVLFFSSLVPSLPGISKMRQLRFPTLLLASLLVSSIFLKTTVAGPPSEPPPLTKPAPPTKPPASPVKPPATPTKPNPSFCDSKCGSRCANAGVYDRCIKYCGICCLQCKCVPSGTYGNKSECPCYRDKLNSKGKAKCP